MHEIDKKQRIENGKNQSHTIHKITQFFSLGNPYRRKYSYKVRVLYFLLSSMEIMQVQRRRYSLWRYLRPLAS
jgi:hypothetical protein